MLQDLRSRNTGRAVRAFKELDKGAESANLPELYSLLTDGDFFVREAAANPLARIEGTRAVPALLQAFQQGLEDGHDNDGLTGTIVEVLERETKEAAELLLDLLKSDDDHTRANAAWALGWTASQITPDVLFDLIDHDPAPVVKEAAVGSLEGFGGSPEVVARLVGMIDSEDEQIAIQAISGLGYLGARTAMPAIESILRTSDRERVQRAAKDALHRLES